MDFGDQPSQPKQIPWKLVAIIAGGIVLAVLIVGGVMYFTRQNGQVNSNGRGALTNVGAPVQTATDVCASATDADACKNAKAKEVASTTKKSDACDVLKDADRDDCYWSVAIAANDAAICTKMSNSDLSAKCADEQNALRAFTARDGTLCDKIGDAQTKSSCQTIITSSKDFVCSGSDVDCVYEMIHRAANQAQDADMCRVLDPRRESTCRSQIVLNDPDHDGLDSTQEILMYKTDPHNADTDGDGYLDGAEVKSGHDPLKK